MGSHKKHNKKHSYSSNESTEDDQRKNKRKKHKSSHKSSKKKKKLLQKKQVSSSSDSSTSSSSPSTDSEEERRKVKKLKRLQKKKSKEKSNDIPLHLMEKSKAMAPMTKEEWEKRQSVVRRVYDESTGRQRLIKGDGEVIEEIVSRDRHKAINQQATRGDGDFFQAKMANYLKK